MRRLFLFGALLLCVGMSSCQCADPPDVGPVEGDDESAALPTQVEDDASPIRL